MKMIVAVGSKNKAKLEAVKAGFGHYFKGAVVKGIAVKSKVSAQPTSLEDITKGAMERAKKALEKAKGEYGVGIEAGILPFPRSNSGYMDTACCAIYDGSRFYFGCSPLYEYPEKVIEKILREKKEVGEAFMELFGLSKEFVSGEESVSGFLTKGAIPRSKLLEQAVVCALAQVINKEIYNK